MAAKKKKAQAQLTLGEEPKPVVVDEKPAKKKNLSDAVWIVDGQGYIFRAYFAMPRMTTSNGVSTKAVFGFANMLLKILKEYEPSQIAICFDPGGKNFRHAIFEQYKGTRQAPPSDLPPQIPLIHKLIDALRIPKVMKPGFEADDAIATLAKHAKAAGHDVVIVTGDKDLCQLVDDKVMLLDEMRLGRGSESNEVRREQVIEKFGVPPERVVDILALAGDSSDNVPGVDGIGEKTAAELVKQFGDLESVIAHADEMKPARRDKLKAQAEQARMSKKLVMLDDNMPLNEILPGGIDAMKYAGPDKPLLKKFFVEMEFKRLVNDPMVREVGTEPELNLPQPSQLPTSTTTVDKSKYRAVLEQNGLREIATTLGAVPRFAVRTEMDRDSHVVGVAVAWGEGDAAWLPSSQLGEDSLKKALAPLLADAGKQIVAHDGKTDINALFAAGWPTWNIAGDPMLASYLLDPDEESTRLVNVGRRTLGYAMMEPDAVFGKGKAMVSADKIPLDIMTSYACEAVDCTLRCANVLEPKLVASEMQPLYRELELPLELLLGEMERAGIKVDVERLKSLSQDFADALAGIAEKALAAAGKPFNLESPLQIAEVLFKDLKLPVVKRTASGAPSTDSTVLEALEDKHDLPALILEHRVISKLKGTYVDVLPTLVDSRKRVHTHFNQAVAATGRLSSTDPNLQNIPVRTELGRKIRDAFIADDGNVICSLDYSQIELRILAHVTQDAVLIDAFRKDEDVHRRTAGEVFGVPYADVSKDQRNAAKAINFGLLYGMGVLRLARELGVPRATAREYHEAYNARLVGVRDWQSKQREQAYVDKSVRTLLGRRRRLHGIDSKNGGERAQAERLATNTPIQGSAADIMKRAMIDTDRALKKEVPAARILLQVHDELVLEVPAKDADKAIEVAKSTMSGAMKLDVPLVVDGHKGRTWNEAH
jgi:DNA polymerase-1